jgi:hypothetical protein
MAKNAIILSSGCLFFLALASIAAAQSPLGLMFNYSQNNNTYVWENSYRRNFNLGRFRSELNINTNSTLMKKPYKRWQESLGATFLGTYNITRALSISPYASQTRNALQNRIVYTSEAKISAPYRGIQYCEFSPFIGNKSLRRTGDDVERNDWGFGYGLGIASRSLVIYGNSITAAVYYENYDLERIPYSEFRADVGSLYEWGESDSLKLNVSEIESSKKYYSGSGLSDRVMRQVKVGRSADYLSRITLARGLSARLGANISRSSYYYSPLSSQSPISEYNNYTQSETYNLQLEKSLFDMLKVMTGYRWYSDKQDFQGSLLDLWSELGELAFKAAAKITDNDSVSLDCILSITSYYGLHGPATNERDLRTQIYNGRFKHIFNRYFWGELKSVYSNFHQIYIRSVNSASNNQNETYLLSSIFGWKPFPQLNLNQIFEIQANYISFDYDRQTINTRNRIFRRGSTTTRLEWRMSQSFTFSPGYMYRYEDYGKLVWAENNWQQATGWDRRYHRLDLKVGYRVLAKLYFEPTYIWELREEYDHSYFEGEITRKQKNRDLKQTSGLTFTWNFNESEYITVAYSRRDWDATDHLKDKSEFINVSVRYIF